MELISPEDQTGSRWAFPSTGNATCCVYVIPMGDRWNTVCPCAPLCTGISSECGDFLLRCGFMTRWRWSCTLSASLLIFDLNDLLRTRQMEEGTSPALQTFISSNLPTISQASPASVWYWARQPHRMLARVHVSMRRKRLWRNADFFFCSLHNLPCRGKRYIYYSWISSTP